jgi:TolB protein
MGLPVLLVVLAVAEPSRAQAPAPPPIHGSAPSISPDGTKIAFLSERDGATDVFLIAADGTGETRLTSTPEAESQPGWSGDGTRIWFTVFADDASRIYSIGVDGADRKLLGTVPGRAMRMSPDGRTMLYWTGTWTAMKLVASSLDGSGAKQLTDGNGVVWGRAGRRTGSRSPSRTRMRRQLQIFVVNADGSGPAVSRPEPPTCGTDARGRRTDRSWPCRPA